MKKERKQELQTNELAQMLVDARQYLSRYGNYMIGGVVVVAAVAVLFMYVRHSRSAGRTDVIQRIESAQFVDAEGQPLSGAALTNTIQILERVAEENKEPDLTRRALMQLSSGVLALALNAPQSMTPESLQAAEGACKRLIRDYGNETIAVGTALLQLATIEGNRFVLDGDPSRKNKAREYLEQITRNEQNLFTATPYMQRALAALNELDHAFQPVKMAAAPPPTPPQAAITPTPDGASPEVVAEPVMTPGPASDEPPAGPAPVEGTSEAEPEPSE